jgi:hypothetical protein
VYSSSWLLSQALVVQLERVPLQATPTASGMIVVVEPAATTATRLGSACGKAAAAPSKATTTTIICQQYLTYDISSAAHDSDGDSKSIDSAAPPRPQSEAIPRAKILVAELQIERKCTASLRMFYGPY